MKKRKIVFLVFMLVVGFAAVSAVLVINGNTNISFDDIDFTSSVIFSKASTDDGIATINKNEQNIDFETKMLSNVGDTAVLEFIIGNKSRQYDANVTINCGLKDTFTSFNDYLDISIDLTSPFELEAGANKSGKLTVKLKKAYTENETTPEVLCSIVASPKTRENVGDEYEPPFSLNGAEPVLDEEGKLVPVNIADDGVVTYADVNEGWHDYEHKKWANAVILIDSPSQTYAVGNTIAESDIESYFVWIPRFRYQIFDTGEYDTVLANKPSESSAKEIKIVFEGKDTEVSTGSEVGDWLTHPAFTNYNTNGIWVGKFETSCGTYPCPVSISTDLVKVKPGAYPWSISIVSYAFKIGFEYERSINSHLIRNTEWGAVAYLSHSKYGILDKVSWNSYNGSSNRQLTGFSGSSAYNTENGYRASTTGNITGVYDMHGCLWEITAGYVSGNQKDAHFTDSELIQYANYFDVYNAGSNARSYNYRMLGDATGEMGPFYSSGGERSTWYSEYSTFVSDSYPWFLRGGDYRNSSSQFAFYASNGASTTASFRITLAF